MYYLSSWVPLQATNSVGDISKITFLTGLEALVVSEAKRNPQFYMVCPAHVCHTTVSDACGKHSGECELIDMPNREVTATL